MFFEKKLKKMVDDINNRPSGKLVQIENLHKIPNTGTKLYGFTR
jgi:hypothetical protein